MAELEEATSEAAVSNSLSKKERKKLKTSENGRPDQPTKTAPKNSKEYARMLESFWKLSEYNESTRMEGTRQIVKYFGQLERGDDPYSYVLTRLVKGLASNRKCSRLGFSSCLTEILNSTPAITLDEILSVAKTHLTTAADKSGPNAMTKEELRHIHIGLLFVYLAWIQSNRLLDGDDQTIRTILNDLNSMRKDNEIKAYTRQLYSQGVVILIKKLSHGTAKNPSIFKNLVLPILSDDLKSVFDDNNLLKIKDNLNLLLACLNSHTDETVSFLKSRSLKPKSLFTSHTLDAIYDLLSQSSESLPSLQPVCVEMISYLIRHQQAYFNQMWTSVVDARLAGKKEPEKKLLAVKFYLLALAQFDEDTYSTLVASSDNLIKTFVGNYANRQSNLSELIRDEMSKHLVEIVREKDGPATLGADLILKFISHTRNFHEISDLISSLIHALKPSSLSKLFEYFTQDFLTNQPDDDNKTVNSDEDREQMSSRQLWMLGQLSSMARNRSLHEAHDNVLVHKILVYFMSNAYFETNQSGFLGEKVLDNIRERLVEVFGVLFSTPSVNRLKQIVESIDDFQKLFKTTKLREKYVKKKSDLEQLSGRIGKLLKQILDHMGRLSSENSEASPSKELASIFQTFFMVIAIELFRSFDSLKNSQQVIDDVEICLSKFVGEIEAESGAEKKKKKNKKPVEDEEIYWLDVLLEMLLNLIAINTTWIRNSVKSQFKKLIPRLRVSSVQLIVDLLNPDAEQDMFDAEGDEDEAEMDVEEVNGTTDKKLNGNSSKIEDEESGIEDQSPSESSLKDREAAPMNGKKRKAEESTDEEESESDDDEDEVDEVDVELKNALEKALGNAAPQEEDNNSDLDDETMMKLDETIAQAFRMRRKDKQQQKEIIQYKSRVLDFIQEIFKSTCRLDLTTYLIKPMFELLFETQTKANLKFLSQRILDFLINVKHSTRKINESKLPSVDDLFELLSHLIQFSTTHFNVNNTLVETSMFCVRLIVHLASLSKTEEEKSSIIKRLNDVYSEIIKNEKTKINPNMYKEYLVRYPANSIALVIQMIDAASGPDVKLHKKTITLVTLHQCVNNQMFNVCENKQISDLFIEKIFKFFDQIMDDMMKHESVHIKFVDAFVNLVNRVLSLPKTLFKKELNEKLAGKLEQLAKEAKFKQAHKSSFQNLIQICSRPPSA